jgi:hypothetical protein
MSVLPWCLLFIVIQLVNLALMPFGWILFGPLLATAPQFARGFPLWGNADDGAVGTSWIARYLWLAWRNPVANLRRVPGVAGAGRPLVYHWWTSTPADLKSGHYIKVGWESGPPYYPVCQPFGAGRGY